MQGSHMYVSLNAVTIHPCVNLALETKHSRDMPEQTHSQPAVSERMLFTPSPTRLLSSSAKKCSKGVEEMSWGMEILTCGSC